MKLEQQVVSLELARKLKEAGVKQESYAYWLERKNERPVPLASFESGAWNSVHQGYEVMSKIASAFTASELGEMLPRIHVQDSRIYKLTCFKELRNDKEEWLCRYECETNNGYHQQTAYTLTDAMAKMLIYLLENKLLTPNH